MSPNLKICSVVIVSTVNSNLIFFYLSLGCSYCSLHPFFCILSADTVQPGTAECPAIEIGNYSCPDKIAPKNLIYCKENFVHIRVVE